MGKIRTFIAFELPEYTKTLVRNTINLLKSEKLDQFRWVNPENIHLTVKFLGDIDEYLIPKIVSELNVESAQQKSFKIYPETVGVFPEKRSPRVIWIGLNHSRDLITFASTVDQTISKFGFPIETRPFRPHITLGRTKNRISESESAYIITRANSVLKMEKPPVECLCKLVFFKSELFRSGPVYTRLEEFTLQS